MANDDGFREIGKPGGEFKVFENLRKALAEKGVNYDALQKLSSIDNPPACFLYRAKGDRQRAVDDYVAWLRVAAETNDIPYRMDMPAEVHYCRDCTPAFKKEACAAGACGFPNVVFETVQVMGERELVGMSRGAPVDPSTYYVYEDMLLEKPDLPPFILEHCFES
jgi:hypothetical protein